MTDESQDYCYSPKNTPDNMDYFLAGNDQAGS